MVEELDAECRLSSPRLASDDYCVSPSEPPFDYLIQAWYSGLDSVVCLLEGWESRPSSFHYFSPSKDQSFTGPTCRKLTRRFALKTWRYFDAVDLFTLSSFAISPIELLGLSPRECTMRFSI